MGADGVKSPKVLKVESCGPEIQERNMQDLLFISATIVFFAVSLGYVHFCDRMK